VHKTAGWEFPLPRTHTGMLLGNGTMGAMVWGEGQILRVTLGQADLWDHRGGMPWTEKQNFVAIRRCLEANDEAGLRSLFVTTTEKVEGQPPRPSVIPVGRVELDLGKGASLVSGSLCYETGLITITYLKNNKKTTLQITMHMEKNLIGISGAGLGKISINDCPAWDTLNGQLEKISFEAPVRKSEKTVGGWAQPMPVNDGIAVYHEICGNTILLTTARGKDADASWAAASLIAASVKKGGFEALTKTVAKWWKSYWKQSPELELPNEKLQFLYQYGMFKFAGLTRPGAIAATLQGPWIEEYQLPPWSSDYHFNINVQMCYWPSYRGNALDHLMPLFDLVLGWEETLKDNAKKFVGVEDGRLLPHAVDDRCMCMGSFWTGTIDHACTAWVAQMMYDYAVFKPDMKFLKEKAYPFMVGTMKVFAAMMEKKPNGKYHLPVSVSPEYGGANMDAWGANSSFQLAAIHKLCENLMAAAKSLKVKADPVWEDIHANLPKASIFGEGDSAHIGLWDGKDLEESHRHHSHLGGMYPFDSIDVNDPEWTMTVARSIDHWVGMGMGRWSGWCMPWASILHSRMGNGRMAELTLEIWKRVFTNEGQGTLHDVNFPGLSLLGKSAASSIMCAEGRRGEIMQMDAGMGATGAIMEMLVQSQRGVLYVMRGVPIDWPTCSFKGVRAEGGVLVDGKAEKGRAVSVTLRPESAARVMLANPFGGTVKVKVKGGKDEVKKGDILTLNLKSGQTVQLLPA